MPSNRNSRDSGVPAPNRRPTDEAISRAVDNYQVEREIEIRRESPRGPIPLGEDYYILVSFPGGRREVVGETSDYARARFEAIQRVGYVVRASDMETIVDAAAIIRDRVRLHPDMQASEKSR